MMEKKVKSFFPNTKLSFFLFEAKVETDADSKICFENKRLGLKTRKAKTRSSIVAGKT